MGPLPIINTELMDLFFGIVELPDVVACKSNCKKCWRQKKGVLNFFSRENKWFLLNKH